MDPDEDVRQAISDLRAGQDFLAIRVSAHEWLLEQLTANVLLQFPADEALAFLDGISDHETPVWRHTEEGPREVQPTRAALLNADVKRLAEKIRERVLQGPATQPSRVPPRR
ncbi:hypothetical protein KOAAANKH_00120 [Brevundimonas sp. NIBR10]|uniref:hypothetical protein n=1 Tax=Brevundimonas sp. NIBR10 TaxID=3015997 RepID=UPI0022F1B574|nr:hypothetical protein [Brevundimonas sp. NIBR10]WGM45259.1 hypothetical protein KOAAANKH_00120 [Brevundimonas sp. NIBR10]